MANSGPNTNGSQFFITYAKQPHLNGLYTIFGKVIHGFEVLDLMEKVKLTYGIYDGIQIKQTYGRNLIGVYLCRLQQELGIGHWQRLGLTVLQSMPTRLLASLLIS